MIFMLARLIVYVDIGYTITGYNPGNVKYQYNIPFYISEIIISLIVVYILYSVSKVQLSQDQNIQKIRQTSNDTTQKRSHRYSSLIAQKHNNAFEESKITMLNSLLGIQKSMTNGTPKISPRTSRDFLSYS